MSAHHWSVDYRAHGGRHGCAPQEFRASLEAAAYLIFPDCGSVLSGASPLSCSRPSSSHDGMLPDAIARLGKRGMIVPAVTTNPWSNLARAKFLASISVSNVWVDRERRLRTAAPRHGSSNVTYQVCFFIRRFRQINHRPSPASRSAVVQRNQFGDARRALAAFDFDHHVIVDPQAIGRDVLHFRDAGAAPDP